LKLPHRYFGCFHDANGLTLAIDNDAGSDFIGKVLSKVETARGCLDALDHQPFEFIGYPGAVAKTPSLGNVLKFVGMIVSKSLQIRRPECPYCFIIRRAQIPFPITTWFPKLGNRTSFALARTMHEKLSLLHEKAQSSGKALTSCPVSFLLPRTRQVSASPCTSTATSASRGSSACGQEPARLPDLTYALEHRLSESTTHLSQPYLIFRPRRRALRGDEHYPVSLCMISG
jgi:hypothetical protein